MTQVLIDRATLEQLVGALEGVRLCTPPAQRPMVREAITAGRAALANAEPKKAEKAKKREPTIDLGKYAGTYGGYITKEPK